MPPNVLKNADGFSSSIPHYPYSNPVLWQSCAEPLVPQQAVYPWRRLLRRLQLLLQCQGAPLVELVTLPLHVGVDLVVPKELIEHRRRRTRYVTFSRETSCILNIVTIE